MQRDVSSIRQSNNLYVFVSNNPIMFIDPLGLFEVGSTVYVQPAIGLNVRSGPGTHHTITGALSQGTQVTVSSNARIYSGGLYWGTVTWNNGNNSGWMAFYHLDATNPLGTTTSEPEPVATTPQTRQMTVFQQTGTNFMSNIMIFTEVVFEVDNTTGVMNPRVLSGIGTTRTPGVDIIIGNQVITPASQNYNDGFQDSIRLTTEVIVVYSIDVFVFSIPLIDLPPITLTRTETVIRRSE